MLHLEKERVKKVTPGYNISFKIQNSKSVPLYSKDSLYNHMTSTRDKYCCYR